jgi:hypothetical protein
LEGSTFKCLRDGLMSNASFSAPNKTRSGLKGVLRLNDDEHEVFQLEAT